METIKFQKDIRDNCDELRNAFSDIYKWEKEMKEQEKGLTEAKNEKIPPVRSSMQEDGKKEKIESKQKGLPPTEKTVKKVKVDENEKLKRKADECKEKGNFYVKSGSYESAIHLYTDAINIINTDPIYYTNRALCYLKLEKYADCIQDCNRALQITSSAVKAFYRRMQAYESMGENKKALEDCQSVLNIEPNNVEAKRSLERIQKRIKEKEKAMKENNHTLNKQPTYIQLKNNMKVITPVSKPAHLRSKKPLKRIPIVETFGEDKESKNYENSTIASGANAPISDEIIDKLFNSNEYANYKQIFKKKSPVVVDEKESLRLKTISAEEKISPRQKAIIVEENVAPRTKAISVEEKLSPKQNTISAEENVSPRESTISVEEKKNLPLPDPPQTTGQFYTTWKELSKENRYFYLKSIEPARINKILGAGLDSETFSDIIFTLSEFYIKNQLDVHKVLHELSNHHEVVILSLLLSSDDKSALTKLLEYMKERKDSEEDIVTIKTKFNLL